MTAIAMNVLLQQLHIIVPAFNVASVPKDATGAYASPVHIIAGLLDKTPTYIQKIICGICANVNANCTKMKVLLNGTEQRNRIMVGNAESIMRVLASCNRQEMAAIVAKLPVVVPVPQAPFIAEAPHAPVAEAPQVSIAPTPQSPDDAMNVDCAPANDLQDDNDITIQDHFDFVPTQMVEFVLELNGSKFYIPVRRDGYVNVTKICQAAGKRLQHYKESPAGKEYMEFLKKRNLAKSDSRNPAITLLTSIRGNCPSRGTFAHPDLAMAIAMWAHPPFLAEVTSWIQELLITGRVELGKEKTPEELDAIWKSRIAEEQAKLQADYLREKLSKELLAIDEDRASKRAREEEDKKDRAAKRQRDDAVAEKKIKDDEKEKEAKRQRDDAAFEEDMRVKKEKGALELANFKKKEELNYNKLLVPFVEDIQNRTNDAHVKALCKDIGMALLNQAKFLISGESSAPQETKFCDDVTTIGRRLGFDQELVEKHRSALGKEVAKEYRRRNDGSDPPSTEKYVNGGNRSVCTYDVKDNEWIGEIVRNFLADKTTPPISTQASQASQRGINKYFSTM